MLKTTMCKLPHARRPDYFEGVIHPNSSEGVITMNTFKGEFNLTDLKVYIIRTLSRV